jgi:hypothetical protein
MTDKRTLCVSTLTRVYTNPNTSLPQLSMAEITGYELLSSFQDLRDHVLGPLRYPKPHSDKLECYGWVPTLFMPSDRTFRNHQTKETFTKSGNWRNGSAEADALSIFYADVDNNESGKPYVTMEDVAANLAKEGLAPSFFLYTSYSHTPEKPKFRVVIDIDRDISRMEMLRMFIWLNWAVLGGQGDPSIYDPGDFIFAPPFQTETREVLSGTPLSVEDILARHDWLRQEHPDSWRAYIERQQPKVCKAKPRVLSPEERQRIDARLQDASVRPEITITNPAIFNPAWSTFYQDTLVGGSHWETMRSLLCMIWRKTDGDLTRGEFERLFHEIDATASAYFVTHHGLDKMAGLLDWVMALPVEVDDEDDWSSIIDQESSGLTVLAMEGECGEGKTHDMLRRMARERGRYVYVVDKIENMEVRRDEFFKVAGRGVAPRFFIREAHSKQPDGLRVPIQLHNIRADLNRLHAGTPAIVFVSHQGAMQMTWDHWTDFEIIIDEVPETFSTFKLKVREHADLLKQYVRAAEEDGNCYSLELTDRGADVARTTDVDDYDAVHHGLLVMLSKPNTFVWVKKAGWDALAEGGKLEFFAITSPLNMRHFRKTWMLGDELTKSSTAKAWGSKWDVTFERVEFDRRKRAIPTAERTTILYFSDHRDSSLTRFREGDIPLTAVSTFIKDHASGASVLWTTNERLKAKADLNADDYISPKAHGRNDLMHYTHVAWLAAMKPSKFEIGTLREVCGMTAQELVDWREFNALYQFVMRGTLREFDSARPAVIYVFSGRQAEYLQRRLGGRIQHVKDIVIDEPIRCVDEDGPMTEAERSKVRYWRNKLLAAGTDDVRRLPKADRLPDREVRLINQTYKLMTAKTNDNEDTQAA